MLVRDCKPDPKRLGVLAECLTGDPSEGEWPGQNLSAHTIAFSCGILARVDDKVTHAHDPDELKRCQRLVAEAAGIMHGVYIGGNDEGDHTLDPFFIPVNSGDPAPKQLTDRVFRSAMRGTVYPQAVLSIEPLTRSAAWWQAISELPHDAANDLDEQQRLAKWGQLLDWFSRQKELRAPVCIEFQEAADDENRATVYPKFFVGLTEAGSMVGLVTCVVWT